MIINNINVKTEWNIKKKNKIIDNNIYQKEFTNYFREQNFKLDTNSTKKIKNQFIKYTDLIYKENKKDYKIAPLIKNLLSNPNLIHRIKKINKEAWNKFIDEIYLEFTKNKNFWKKINLIRSKKMKMILDNKNMIEEYFGHIQKNSIETSKEILNYIKNLKIKN
ncbi:hypothetical protein M0812_18264 [Anaeramoeba flamelloides]|uniref:Uncharacterized protein n=1 Tax=Anaeramoeba flamelloides TaxID=1746091 RepID=A0AAV7Z5W6_9EUKA|nr:hypothetical protein M0812_18264 [Anaeramoeba flamelloides]